MPEYHIDVDWEKAGTLGVHSGSIHTTLSAAFRQRDLSMTSLPERPGEEGISSRADAPYRMLPKDLETLCSLVRQGEMVPFTAFRLWSLDLRRWQTGGSSLPSTSGRTCAQEEHGEAMLAMEEAVAQLPQGVRF